jgi:hypothetical protein
MRKIDLTIGDTRRADEQIYTVCACGEEGGAAFYATEHQAAIGTIPLIIEIEARIDQVWVDGRDFLYTAFQLFDKRGSQNLGAQRVALSRCFGKPVLPYFDAAAKHAERNCRIAMCDLAVEDDDVIKHHHRNQLTIHGRCGTRFCSAFAIALPVAAQQIVDVRRPSRQIGQHVGFSLDDFLAGQIRL